MLETGIIALDLDRVRIRDILAEAYKGCADLLGTEFDVTMDVFVSKIEPYLASNRVSIPVQVSLPSRRYPELKIDVDLRQRKVFARMASKSKQAMVNYFLKTL